MMEWTIENETICSDLALEAEILYMAHSDEYRKYRKYSFYFIFPTVVISSIIGGLSFSESFNSSNENKLILGSCNIFLAILNSLFKILNIQDYETQNFYLSKMYYLLYEQIRIELAKAPYERIQCNEFIKSIITIKTQLIEKNIILNKDVIKKYRKKYKNNEKLNLPLSFQHLSPIIIYNRGNQSPLTPSSSLEVNI